MPMQPSRRSFTKKPTSKKAPLEKVSKRFWKAVDKKITELESGSDFRYENWKAEREYEINQAIEKLKTLKRLTNLKTFKRLNALEKRNK